MDEASNESAVTMSQTHEKWPYTGVWVDAEVAADTSLTLAERFLLSYILGFERQGKRCFATATHIGAVLGLSAQYVREVRQALIVKNKVSRLTEGDKVFYVSVAPISTPTEGVDDPNGGVGKTYSVGNSYGGCRKNLQGVSEIPTGGVGKTYTYNKDINKEIVVERVSTPPPPQGTKEWFKYQAEKSLAEPTGNEAWERDNQFVAAGRRPMTKFPGLWFTPAELADAIEVVIEALPPDADIKPVFALAQAEALTKLADRSAKKVSAFKYVTGYCLQQISDTLRKSNYLQNSRSK
jgi:hypothetical protein